MQKLPAVLTSILVLLLVLSGWPGVLGAQGEEPDLSGFWHRENGATLEAKRSPLDGSWTFTLAQAAPGAGAQARETVGHTVITGLRWNGVGAWTRGKVHGGSKKKGSEVDCELMLLDPRTADLKVTALFTSKTERLRR